MKDLAVLPHYSGRQILNLVLLFIPTVFLTGCATNLYVEHGYKIAKPPVERPSVFVEESPLTKELEILKASSLYEISEDPTVSKHIVLKPMHEGQFGCGMSWIVPVYTLGLLPESLPARHSPHQFEYILRDNNGEQLLSYKLPGIYMRISIWENFFKPFKSENRVLGKVLRTEALRKYKTTRCALSRFRK